MIKNVGGVQGSIEFKVADAQKNIKTLKKELQDLQKVSEVFEKAGDDISLGGYKALLSSYKAINKEVKETTANIKMYKTALEGANDRGAKEEVAHYEELIKSTKAYLTEVRRIQASMKALKASTNENTDFVGVWHQNNKAIENTVGNIKLLEKEVKKLNKALSEESKPKVLEDTAKAAEDAAQKILANKKRIEELKVDLATLNSIKTLGKESALSSLALDLEVAEMNYEELKEAIEDVKWALEKKPSKAMLKDLTNDLNRLQTESQAAEKEVKRLTDTIEKLETMPVRKANIARKATEDKIKELEAENQMLLATEDNQNAVIEREKLKRKQIEQTTEAIKKAAKENAEQASKKTITSNEDTSKPATPIADSEKEIKSAIGIEQELASKLKNRFKEAGKEVKGVSDEILDLLEESKAVHVEPIKPGAVDASYKLRDGIEDTGDAVVQTGSRVDELERKIFKSSQTSEKLSRGVETFAKRLKHLSALNDEETYNSAFKLNTDDFKAAKGDVNVLAKMMKETQAMAIEVRNVLDSMKSNGNGFSQEATDMSNYLTKLKGELKDLKKIELGKEIFNEEDLMQPFSGKSLLGENAEETTAKIKAKLDATVGSIYEANETTGKWYDGLKDIEDVFKVIQAYSSYDMMLIDSEEVEQAVNDLTKLMNRSIVANNHLRKLAQEGARLTEVSKGENATAEQLKAVENWAIRAKNALNLFLNQQLKLEADKAFAKKEFADFGLNTKGVSFMPDLNDAVYTFDALQDKLLGLDGGFEDLKDPVDDINKELGIGKDELEKFIAPLHEISKNFTNIKTQISDMTGLIKRASMEWQFFSEKQKEDNGPKLLGPGKQVQKYTPPMNFDFGNFKAESGAFEAAFTEVNNQASKTSKYVNDVKDTFGKMRGVMRGTNEQFKMMAAMSKDTHGAMKDISRVVQGIIISQTFYRGLNAMQSFLSSIKEAHLMTEQIAVSFGSMFKDFDMGNAFIKELQKFAAVTPFEFQDVAKNARLLSAYGFQAREILPVMQKLSDASAAMGDPEALTRVTRALGQIRTKGRLMQEELRQLNEAGINTSQILVDQLGLTKDQMAEIGKLKIPAETAITAILKGIEKQFGGSADALSKTAWGLLSTIKDNIKLIGMEVSSGLFNSYKEMLSGITKRLVGAAREMTNVGFGGWMDKNFSPATVAMIRNAAANISMFVKNLKLLWQAIKPVATEMGRLALTMFNLFMPVINGVNRVLYTLVGWFTNLSPVVSRFIAILAGLFVANLASIAIRGLAVAISKLFIVQAATTFIKGLANAVKILTVACIKNPIIAALTILGGVLAYVALQSDFATKMINKLSGTLNGFMKNDTSSYFAPKKQDSKAWKDWANSLDKGSENLNELGENAEEAGKKAKESLASFDEVFTLNLDSGTDNGKMEFEPDIDFGSLDDLINGYEPPGIDVPVGPSEGSLPSFNSLMGELFKGFMKFSDKLANEILPIGQLFDTIIIPLHMLSDTIYIVGHALSNMGRYTKVAFGQVAEVTSLAASQIADVSGKAWDKFKTDSINAVDQMKTKTLEILGPWWSNTKTGFSDWWLNTKTGFGEWWEGTKTGFGDWISNTFGNLGTWWSDTTTLFGSWKDLTWEKVATWWSDTKTGFFDWCSTTGSSISGWWTDTTGRFSSWVSSTFSGLSTWWSDTKTSFGQWKESICGIITGWWEDTKSTVSTWSSNVSGIVSTWWVDIKGIFNEWKGNIGRIWDGMWEDISNSASRWLDKLKESWGKFTGFWGDAFQLVKDKTGEIFGKQSVDVAASYSLDDAPKPATFAMTRDALAAPAPRFDNNPSTDILVGRRQQSTVGSQQEKQTGIDANTIGDIVNRAVSTAMQNMPTPVYAGTVIADERSLKDLSRKITVISQGDRRR